MEYKHSRLTDSIINAFYRVYNNLSYAFLEKVYENALAVELSQRGHRAMQQVPIEVRYKGVVLGSYFADLWVDDAVIVEVKAAAELDEAHEAQLLNYLRATGVLVDLLLNFGKEPQVTRKAYNHTRRRTAAKMGKR